MQGKKGASTNELIMYVSSYIWILHFEIYEATITATIEGLLGLQIFNSLTTVSFHYQNTNSEIAHRESTIMNIQLSTKLIINSISAVVFSSVSN